MYLNLYIQFISVNFFVNLYIQFISLLPCPFSEIEKSALVLGKNILILDIYGLNFSFKNTIFKSF